MKCPRLRFLVPLLASLILMTGADALALYASSAPDRYGVDQRIAAITWEAACRISQYEICPDKGPVVRRSIVIGELGSANGIYFIGSDVVWLDTPRGGTGAWLTIFHEQIHFLQSQNLFEINEYDDWMLGCLVEREALDFTNTYAQELRRPELQRSIEVWEDLYKCKLSNKPRHIMIWGPGHDA